MDKEGGGEDEDNSEGKEGCCSEGSILHRKCFFGCCDFLSWITTLLDFEKFEEYENMDVESF